MYIDKLIQQKNEKIKEHEKRFPNDEPTLEMFTKKYEGSYYKKHGRYERTNYSQPFINKLKLNQEEDSSDITYFNVKKFPKLDEKKYKMIENFPDYDYLNSIAYEMLIRTKEYKQLRHPNNEDSNEDKKKKFNLLGIDIDDIYDLKTISEKENNSFGNSYLEMTINDVEQGLDKLIEFYIKEKQIYVIDSIKETMLNEKKIINKTYKIVSNITFKDIKSSLSNYYIPIKSDNGIFKDKDNKVKIDKGILLVMLNDKFLLSIKELIPNRIKESIDFNFTKPLLRFKELPIVDAPINLNLSKEELTQFVLKLKDDFEEGSIKNPIDILYNRKYKIQEIKNITPFKMTKKSIAEAFFIYDLYQVLNNVISLHKKRLNNFKRLDIEKIETNMRIKKEEKKNEINKIIKKLKTHHRDNKTQRMIEVNERDLRKKTRELIREKKREIARIKKMYKKYSKDYHTMTVLENLVYKKAISHYTCKQYLKFMRKYVERLKYKELLIGIEI